MPKNSNTDPINVFFNELLDRVVDDLLDIVEPHFEEIARQSVKFAKSQASQAKKVSQPQPGNPKSRKTTHSGPQEHSRTRQTPPPPHQTPSQAQETLYDVLEVSSRASQETITAAFRSLGRRYHPDNLDTGNADKMRAITAAYQVLKDPESRGRYDRKKG